jgi:hypothetical protein
VDSVQTVVKLRSEPNGTGNGFDVLRSQDAGRMQLIRIAEGGLSVDAPYDVKGEDAAKLRKLVDDLGGMVNELARHKKSLVRAAFDGTPFQQVESPRALVDRIVASIAPTVHEIARRSLAPDELVLKRLLGDNRREEIFVSLAELDDKLQGLSPVARKAFEPLGLSNPRPSTRAPAPLASAATGAPKEEKSSEGIRRSAPRPASQPPSALASPSTPSQPPPPR